MPMRVLVVGSGAREHALVWKLAQSPDIEALFVAPGNAGTAQIATNLPIAASDTAGLVAAARRERIDLTVVGPEDPLAAGLADAFIANDLAVFGPVADAARIESSKAWAKDVMESAGVPTARSQRFTDLNAALDAVFDVDLARGHKGRRSRRREGRHHRRDASGSRGCRAIHAERRSLRIGRAVKSSSRTI